MTATLVHRYEPLGAAREAMHCRDPEVLLSGPAGTGKSRAAMEKLHMMALANPGMRGLIVRKTLASLGSTALVTWREHVVKEALAAGIVTFYGGSPQEAPSYRYENGSVILVTGMDKAVRVMSSEFDVCYVQEAIELTTDDWESLTTRLRNGRITFQQVIADTNPSHPTHWLKARCDAGKTTLLESRHEDNPVLFRDGAITERGRTYLAKLDNLTGPRYSRLRKGLWVAAEGLVYEEEYDPAIHLIDRFDIPQAWPRWWAVDFGYTNPMVIQCYAEDPDGRLFLYREIYHTRRLVAEHAKKILSLVRRPAQHVKESGRTPDPEQSGDWEWTEPKPRAIICDHDAEGRAQLERHLGMSTTAAHKAVTEGIQAVQQRMKPAGDGRPRFYILRDSLVEKDMELDEAKRPTCTPEELVGYIWDTGPGKAPKETPVKADDHGCDTVRYCVAEVDLRARPRIRRL